MMEGIAVLHQGMRAIHEMLGSIRANQEETGDSGSVMTAQADLAEKAADIFTEQQLSIISEVEQLVKGMVAHPGSRLQCRINGCRVPRANEALSSLVDKTKAATHSMAGN